MGDSHPSRIQHNLSLYQVADSEPPSANARPAEWLDLPQTRVIAIEHPCIVNDIDKGLKSLGGENLIKTVGLSFVSHSSFSPLMDRVIIRSSLKSPSKDRLLALIFVLMILLRRNSYRKRCLFKMCFSESAYLEGLVVSGRGAPTIPLLLTKILTSPRMTMLYLMLAPDHSNRRGYCGECKTIQTSIAFSQLVISKRRTVGEV